MTNVHGRAYLASTFRTNKRVASSIGALIISSMLLLLQRQTPFRMVHAWSTNSRGCYTKVASRYQHSMTTSALRSSRRRIQRYPFFLRMISSASTLPKHSNFNATSTSPSSKSNISYQKQSFSSTGNHKHASEQDVTPSTNTPHKNNYHQWTEDNWRHHPDLNPTLSFPTWAVPLEHTRSIQALLSSKLTQPYLATRDEIFRHINPRPKIVQDGENNKNAKLILLRTDGSFADASNSQSTVTKELMDLLQKHQVQQGPNVTISIEYHQFPLSYILERLLPQDAHPVPTAFETVGHVAHLNLRQEHVPYAKMIGQVLLECLPTIETVIQKVGQVTGPYRTYDYEVLAGRHNTTVQLVEHGVRLEFDLSKVYWCSRLGQERQVILDQEIKQGQVIADAFSGVGAICLRAALTRNCTILANDWNPDAVKYLKHNFALNKLDKHLGHVSCQDAYEFLMDLGLISVKGNNDGNDDAGSEMTPIVDHVLMNFPLKAPSFLGALRWWPEPLSSSSPRVHVYTFARADPDTERSAEDVAVDLVASELLPLMGACFEGNDDGIYHRKQELNDEYDCKLLAREVRDVAPGKVVFCVSFTATPKLLRHMQGNFD